MSYIVDCLKKDLGISAGIRYAGKIAANGGMYAQEYQIAAQELRKLDLENMSKENEFEWGKTRWL